MKRIVYKMTALTILAILFIACGEQVEEEKSNLIIPVKAEKVMRVKIVAPIITSGKVISSKESNLSFKIPGILKRINVKEGQSVKSGETLASLDLSEMKANLTKAKNGFEKTERDFDRIKKLYEDEVATLEQLQNTQTAFDIARSDLEIAEFNYKYSTITAPSDGTILMKNVEENELINAGYPVIMFGSNSANWKIKTGIADVDIVRISIGDSAEVSFDAYPNILFSAEVTETGQAADPRIGTYDVTLAIKKSTHKLASGFVGKIKIYPREKTDVALIPIQSITQSNRNNGIVYIPKGNTVEQRAVTTGGIYSGKLVVTMGLKEGEEIITDGVEYLTQNSQIKLVSVN